jgi:N-acyl-phosphatidylethanolamine-hydrolysing phospholipase D
VTTPTSGAGLASEGVHRRADGAFFNPWPDAAPHDFGDFLRWVTLERWQHPRPSDPAPGWLPRVAPAFHTPRAPAATITATWVGHSTFLVQVGRLNVLTDPMWSERASPVPFAGPRRQQPPGIAFDALPPIDVVLQSHDHYDHLDDKTVRAVARAHPAAQWFAPLGVAEWLRAHGVVRVRELDWWGEAPVERATAAGLSTAGTTAGTTAGGTAGADRSSLVRGAPPTGKVPPNEASDGPSSRRSAPDRARDDESGGGAGATAGATEARVVCLPAQHFAGRGLHNRDGTLWCGWALRVGERAVYFAGDSGLHPEFELIARRAGPFDLALLPIGAYAPRWFMRPVHADPADAVEAYTALVRGNGGRRLVCGGMHWGTFKLTDEPLDEPPRVMRERWAAARLDAADLWIPACGETRTL